MVSQLSVPAIIMNIYRTSAVSNRLTTLLENHSSYMNFQPLAHLQVQFSNLAAVIVFLAWVKVSLPLNTTTQRNELSLDYLFLIIFIII